MRTGFSVVAVVAVILLAVGWLAWRRALAGGESPLACNPRGMSSAQRVEYAGLMSRLTTAVKSEHELADGFAFEVDPERMDLGALGRWMELERRCCPFFHFALQIEPDGGATWLELTGRQGVKQLVRLELGELTQRAR